MTRNSAHWVHNHSRMDQVRRAGDGARLKERARLVNISLAGPGPAVRIPRGAGDFVGSRRRFRPA